MYIVLQFETRDQENDGEVEGGGLNRCPFVEMRDQNDDREAVVEGGGLNQDGRAPFVETSCWEDNGSGLRGQVC